jgi:hypothetical protein
MEPFAFGPVQGHKKPLGIARRTQQMRGLKESFELVGGNQNHISRAATVEGQGFMGLNCEIPEGRQISACLGVTGSLAHALLRYRFLVRPATVLCLLCRRGEVDGMRGQVGAV